VNSGSVQRVVYALLRIVVTFVYMQHGWQKLFGALGGFDPNGAPAPLHSLFGLAGVIETFVGPFVLFGLFTRPAACIMSGEMAAAYFLMHAPHGFWTIQNHGELPVVFCFSFLFFAAFGGGFYSLDTLFGRTHHRVSSEDAARRA